MLKYFLKCASHICDDHIGIDHGSKEENGEKKHFLISERVFMQIFSKSQAKKKFSCDLAGLFVLNRNLQSARKKCRKEQRENWRRGEEQMNRE